MIRVFIVLLLLIPGISLRGWSKSCTDIDVKKVRIIGLITPKFKKPDFKEKLMLMTDIVPPYRVKRKNLALIKGRFMKTGLFRDVRFECQKDVMLIKVRENRHIGAIKVKGNHKLFTSQILSRLFVAPGDVLNPDSTAGRDMLNGIRDQVISIYNEAGFYGTRVAVTWKVQKHANIVVQINVHEGKKRKIGRIRFSTPNTLVGQGPHCAVITRAGVLKYAKIRRGQVFTQDYIRDKKNRIHRYLQMFGITNAKVKIQYHTGDGALNVDIYYSKCWAVSIVVHREGEGWGPASDIGLYEALPFGRSGIYNLEEAKSGIDGIRNYLEERGYFFVKTRLFYKRLYGYARTGKVKGIIQYTVVPGIRMELRRIRFHGNSQVDKGTLKELMRTKEYDFFGSPGILIIENIFADLENIKHYYISHGFYKFRFLGTRSSDRVVMTRYKKNRGTVYHFAYQDKAFDIKTWPNDEGVYLEINLKEGPQRKISNLTIRGNRHVESGKIKGTIGLKKDGPFSLELLRESTLLLKRLLASKGYLQPEVIYHCKDETGQVFSCDAPPDGVNKVAVLIEVREGPLTRVGQILVYGNTKTRDKVIIRDMPRSGAPFDRSALPRATGNLKDLGIFSGLDVKTIGPDEYPPRKKATIIVHAREAKTKFIDISLGFESMNRNEDFPKYVSNNIGTEVSASDHFWGFTGRSLGLNIPDILITAQFRYSDINLLGTSYRLYLPVKYGFSMTAWDRYAVFAPSFVDPYFLLPKMVLRVTPFGVYDRATGNLDIIRFGNEIAISKYLGHRLYTSFSYEISTVKTRVPDSGRPYSPWVLENKVIPTLTYDGLDQPINPYKGFYASAILSYINALVSDDFQNFVKFETTFKFFWSIRKLVTFGVDLHYGDSKPLDADKLPQDERFTLGGNKGVRGFSHDGIAQYNSDGSLRLQKNPDGTYSKPFGGNTVLNGSFEIRFPIVRKANIFGATFVDWGGLGEGLKSFNSKTIRTSVGLGLRYILAGQLPIRLDYGFILDRRCKYANPKSGQCVEREEVGNIQFSLLYSF